MSKYQIIDLFSGAGGLSYGFEQAGCEIKLAIEKDVWAVDTYKANHSNQNIIEADITTLGDEYFAPYKGKIDIVMGGPPCQGFSIAASNRRKMDDSRNSLYRHFLRVVSIVEPAVVLIENVKEIVGYKLPDGTKIVEDIKQFFDKAGYGYDYGILNCRYYGIPQDRKRFFFVAKEKYGVDPEILPFSKEDYGVYRHTDTGKWFAVFIVKDRSAFGLPSSGDMEVVSFKIRDRMLADFVAQQLGYLSGFPASNWNWTTAVLDGMIPFEDICRWVDESYTATKTKAKNKRTPLPKMKQ